MNKQNRRYFLKAGTTFGASVLATSAYSFSSSGKKEEQGEEAKKLLPDMKSRTLGSGKHSLKVSALGLGCMGMSYHRSFIPDKKVSIALIRKAYDMGVTFFDTAMSRLYSYASHSSMTSANWLDGSSSELKLIS